MQNSSVEFHKKTPEGYLRFGSISGVFGFNGEAKFFLYNPKTELYGKWLKVFSWEQNSVREAFDIELRKGAGKRVVGKVKRNGQLIQDESSIRKLMGTELLLLEADLPSLESDEFYHHQLLGLVVEYENGESIGHIQEITQGVVDVFTIRLHNSKEVMYVPFTKDHVLSTTLEKMVIRRYDSEPNTVE